MKRMVFAAGAIAIALVGVVGGVVPGMMPVPAFAATGMVSMVDGLTGCRMFLPPAWKDMSVRWSGSCPAGRAAGTGVVRGYVGNRLAIAFFGELDQGEWRLGVLDDGGGYQAGRFQDGRPDWWPAPKPAPGTTADVDARRTDAIAAFDLASKAARALAEEFARQGNRASSEFYRHKSSELAEQMD